MKKIIAIVQARTDSSRFPKNFRKNQWSEVIKLFLKD